jgi:hypothetical protein
MTEPQGESAGDKALAVATATGSNNQVGATSLTMEKLLAALDAQIKFITDSQRNEGLTRWAMWGALAGLVWVVRSWSMSLYREQPPFI